MSRSRQVALAAVTVLVFVAAVAVITIKSGGDTTSGSATEKAVKIKAGDGVELAANVFTPKNVSQPPLVIMPAGWGQSGTMYRSIATDFARTGYLVVAYAQRGFEGSGGEVDFAGERTQGDVSDVIDWALRSTGASRDHIGAFAMSYGAGVSLLAAARDKRIRAVVALSTWSDVAASYDPNGTPSTTALATLLASGAGSKRLDASTTTLRDTLKKQPRAVGPMIEKLSPTRSPAHYVDQLNANKPAILLANGYQDSLFGPQQLVSFFGELSTPKRLQLAPVITAAPEASALQGQRNATVDDGHAWLDHFLRGVGNGIDTEDPVKLLDGRTGAVHTYPAWPKNTTRDEVPLGVPLSKQQTGTDIARTWRATIVAGADTVATSGTPTSPFGAYRTPEALLPSNLSRLLSFAWTGPAVEGATLLSGTPSVRFRLTATKPSGTLIGYMYDLGPDGKGRLLSVQPYSFSDVRAGKAQAVDLTFQPVSWTLPPGHRFVVAMDTVDPRYSDLNPEGARLTAASTRSDPAVATIPIR